MKFRVMLLILIPTLAVSVTALAWPEQGEADSEREARIALTDAPKAVQEAVLRAALTTLKSERRTRADKSVPGRVS